MKLRRVTLPAVVTFDGHKLIPPTHPNHLSRG